MPSQAAPDAVPGAWAEAVGSDEVGGALDAVAHVHRIEVVGQVGSTQDVARALAVAGAPSGTLVVAERQVTGRGRRGRRWDDDARPGASLAATLVLEPPAAPHLVPHAVGLAVLDAVAPWLAGRAALKWPNDLVVRTDDAVRKVAGLLVEREGGPQTGGRTVLLAGVGVNVDRRHLPPGDDRAGIADLAGTDVAPATLLAGMVRGLDAALELLARGPVALLDRYRGVSDTRGREVDVVLPDGTGVRGRADVDDEGRLVVTSTRGRHVVLSGTVRDAGS